jgi:hypothetical protein
MLQSAAALGKQVRTRLWPLGTGALIDLSESAYSVALASSLGGVFSTSQSREVRNADNDMPAIVLNYDRNPALAESLKRQVNIYIYIYIFACMHTCIVQYNRVTCSIERVAISK